MDEYDGHSVEHSDHGMPLGGPSDGHPLAIIIMAWVVLVGTMGWAVVVGWWIARALTGGGQ